MKKIILFLLASVIFTACMQPLEQTASTQNYLIKGTLNGDFGDSIAIRYRSQLDSTVITNNTFQFEGEVSSPTAFRFEFDSLNSSETFYLENDTLLFDIIIDQIQIENDYYNSYQVRQLDGGNTAQLKTYSDSLLENTLNSKINRNLIANKIDSLIKSNPNHDYLGQLLLQTSTNQVLLYNELRTLIGKLDKEELNPEDVNLLEASLEKRKKFQIGSKIPDYKLLNIANDEESLAKNFNDYNLLVFWSSWCEHCKTKQKEIQSIYEKFKFKGFEVISIALNTNQNEWISSVTELSMPWKSLRIENGFTGDMASEMGILSLPQYYLVDQNGRILEINLSTDELKTILSALLN